MSAVEMYVELYVCHLNTFDFDLFYVRRVSRRAMKESGSEPRATCTVTFSVRMKIRA